MDIKGDAINLGDDEIVKDTQFSSDNCSGTEVQATTEQRVLYGSSQDTSIYNNSPYMTFGGMRPPPLQHQQISYTQQNAWPNYGPGYRSGVHPMHHSIGTAMYSPFQSGNFSGLPSSFSGHTHGGPPDSVLFSQVGHVPLVNPNMEWMSVQNVGQPVQETFRGATIIVQGARNSEPHPLSTREPASSGGPWCCPRSTRREDEQPENMNPSKRHFTKAMHAPSVSKSMGEFKGPPPPQPSEMVQSTPLESAETQEGPIHSDSVGVERPPGASMYGTETLHAETPSQYSRQMHRSMDTPSKCNTPQSLLQRKALREDEKTYMKEVKRAIAEGRVPQVTVVQDNNGNIVRYKAQFLNALKLATHAVVQDAYINVTDQDTMNEIKKEVSRQFIVHEPLPTGMVESYLRGYFKRCRSQYHKFWIKNGDKKKPDGCKQASWLQLIDYWKSVEGKKECKQNKLNATTDKHSSRKKLKSDGQCCGEDIDTLDGEAKWLLEDDLGVLDSMAFDCGEPRTSTGNGDAVQKNPMADISNQLHRAVDSILFSFAERCASLPSSAMQKENGETPATVIGSTDLRGSKVVSRTTAEVLGSLQRPKTTERGTCFPRAGAAQRDILSRMSVERQVTIMPENANTAVDEANFNLEAKDSGKNTSSKGTFKFVNAEAEETKVEKKVMVAPKVTLLLSSDGSSDGMDFNKLQGKTGTRLDDIASKLKGTCTEEIEGWAQGSTQTRSAVKISGRQPSVEFEEAQRMHQQDPQCKDESKQKFVLEEEETDHCRAKEESLKGNTSKNVVFSDHGPDNELNKDFESISEDEMEEVDARDAEDDYSSDKEEEPVVPKQVVKRKLDRQFGAPRGNKELKDRRNRRTSCAAVKKQKGNQIDASIIKKLEFFKRPKNSNPIKTRTRVWVLHPKFVGKVVAEANAGVNRKSRCVDSANEMCKEGQQMISVLRVLYRNTPVMFDMNSRFPKQISYLDQAEGVPNMPILWCVCHLIEIPTVDQITRMLGPLMKHSSQESENTESDLKNSNRKVERNMKGAVQKENRRGRPSNVGSSGPGGSKVGRTVLRSANV